MRLIDADAMKESIQSTDTDEKKVLSTKELHTALVEWIDGRHTIDAVPVVRCKDCKWHEQEQPGMVYCPATVGGWVEDGWFCKGGEREDNADE